MDELKVKVVVVGTSGVGKTSLIRRYALDEFSDTYRETLGAVVTKRVVDVPVDGQSVHVTMTIWDTMGEPAVSELLRDVFLDGVQGVLAVCDVTDEQTVPVLQPWVDATFRFAGGAPVHILMNKSDLGMSGNARTAGLRIGQHRGLPCYLTSAKAGANVVDAFEDLARRIVERHLVPVSGTFEDADMRVQINCTAAPRTVEDVARLAVMPEILAAGRLERLRRRGFLRVASVDLDPEGRPRIQYASTGRPLKELLDVAQ